MRIKYWVADITEILIITFHSDLDDVGYRTQLVGGRTAIVASVSFNYIRNFQCFPKVVEGHPAVWKLPPFLLPGDIWSWPISQKPWNWGSWQWNTGPRKKKDIHPSDKTKFSAVKQMPTYNPSAMHSSSKVSPLRTILVLEVPRGNMKLGRRSPSGLSEHKNRTKTKSGPDQSSKMITIEQDVKTLMSGRHFT